MQASVTRRENPGIADRISEEFEEKLKVTRAEVDNEAKKREDEEEEDEEEEEDDFSFACTNPDGSPVAADAVFHNGQIRPIFPLFDQSLIYDDVENEKREDSSASASARPPLRKLFVEEESKQEEPAGPYCEWKSAKTIKEVTPETCKKSNSTGFSKLWRFRELVLRSNSDGRDAFVFLNNGESIGDKEKSKSSATNSRSTGEEKQIKNEKAAASEDKTSKRVQKVKMTGGKKVKADTVSSAYERHYVKNREMRDGVKRKTYSPYRQDLLGFFTNVNGMSKNVHPF